MLKLVLLINVLIALVMQAFRLPQCHIERQQFFVVLLDTLVLMLDIRFTEQGDSSRVVFPGLK